MSPRRHLRRLQRPDVDRAAICAQASEQAERLAAEATDEEVREAWRAEHPEVEPDRPDLMLAVRAWYEDCHTFRIRREIGEAAAADCNREFAAMARAEVVAACGLDPAGLTAEVAEKLLAEAWQCWLDLDRTELRYQADPAAQRNARAAATRAQLEGYLVAAGLITYPPWDGD
ncbi:MAG TPA: hypothetical protein VNF47_04585 [Streptosporangiaceae bacterium]|nr:hypothetical protein [Streptosporangiaceae bacterium]